MPRLVYLLGVGLALVALALAFTDWALRSRVTEANARRIRAGLTLAEVEALLGGPARQMSEFREDRSTLRVGVWEGPTCIVWVTFGPTNRVAGRSWRRRDEPSGLLDSLRAWLGW
jgi:hypothetical protein